MLAIWRRKPSVARHGRPDLPGWNLPGLVGRGRSATLTVMARFAYRLLLVLIVSAVIGGPAGQLVQAAAPMAQAVMADMPCDMAMPMADAGRGAPMVPCKGLTPECIKQMGCVANAALPVRMADSEGVTSFSPVAYWSTWSLMTGMAHTPEPLPPRTV